MRNSGISEALHLFIDNFNCNITSYLRSEKIIECLMDNKLILTWAEVVLF